MRGDRPRRPERIGHRVPPPGPSDCFFHEPSGCWMYSDVSDQNLLRTAVDIDRYAVGGLTDEGRGHAAGRARCEHLVGLDASECTVGASGGPAACPAPRERSAAGRSITVWTAEPPGRSTLTVRRDRRGGHRGHVAGRRASRRAAPTGGRPAPGHWARPSPTARSGSRAQCGCPSAACQRRAIRPPRRRLLQCGSARGAAPVRCLAARSAGGGACGSAGPHGDERLARPDIGEHPGVGCHRRAQARRSSWLPPAERTVTRIALRVSVGAHRDQVRPGGARPQRKLATALQVERGRPACRWRSRGRCGVAGGIRGRQVGEHGDRDDQRRHQPELDQPSAMDLREPLESLSVSVSQCDQCDQKQRLYDQAADRRRSTTPVTPSRPPTAPERRR